MAPYAAFPSNLARLDTSVFSWTANDDGCLEYLEHSWLRAAGFFFERSFSQMQAHSGDAEQLVAVKRWHDASN